MLLVEMVVAVAVMLIVVEELALPAAGVTAEEDEEAEIDRVPSRTRLVRCSVRMRTLACHSQLKTQTGTGAVRQANQAHVASRRDAPPPPPVAQLAIRTRYSITEQEAYE